MEDVVYYKALGRLRLTRNGGSGRWLRKGQWMPRLEGTIYTCSNGYHLATADQIPYWFGPRLWVAEGRGDHVEEYGKSAWREARLVRKAHWNWRTARALGRYMDGLAGYPLLESIWRHRPWWSFNGRWHQLTASQQAQVAEWLQERL